MDPLTTLALPFAGKYRKDAFTALLLLLSAVIGVIGLEGYLDWTAPNFIIGMLALPLMFRQSAARASYRFGWLSLFLLVLSILLPVKTILYLALCSTLLFLYESMGKRATMLPLFTFFLMSPVCAYLAEVFSFPIRLWLTRVAVQMLLHLNLSASAAGNIITFGGAEYSVDPACMGLNMLVTSLLCGLVLLTLYQKKKLVTLHWRWLPVILSVLLLLNVLANLFRILLLVYFRLLPENPMHDWSGIICLLVYVLLPASFGIRKIVAWYGRPLEEAQAATLPVGRRLQRVFHVSLLPMLAIASYYNVQQHKALPRGVLPRLAGYHVSWYDRDVIKISGEQALVYFKPLKGFVYTEHNPLICWTACGYAFKQVNEEVWNGLPLFTGLLTKDNEQLYTAWWYENGTLATTSQWTWRWEMFRGAPSFGIINVTASSPVALKAEVAKIVALRKRIFDR